MYGKVVETPQTRKDAVLSPQPLRLRQGLAYWQTVNYRESLRHVRLQRHPVQPRKPPPGRDVCHPQDHPGRDAHQGRPAEEAVPRQSRRQARLGICRGLCRGHVADAPAGPGRTIMSSPPAKPTASANFSTKSSAGSIWNGRNMSRWTRAISARPRWTCSWAIPARPGDVLGWKPR